MENLIQKQNDTLVSLEALKQHTSTSVQAHNFSRCDVRNYENNPSPSDYIPHCHRIGEHRTMSLDPERNTIKHHGKDSWEKVSADAYFFAASAAKQHSYCGYVHGPLSKVNDT